MTERKKYNFISDEFSFYKKGLALQREIYKASNIDKDFNSMVSAIENIKIEIKSKVIAKGNEDQIKRVEKIIKWYKTLYIQHSVKTSTGEYVLRLPVDIDIKINHNLNIAYEILIKEMSILGIL